LNYFITKSIPQGDELEWALASSLKNYLQSGFSQIKTQKASNNSAKANIFLNKKRAEARSYS